MTIRWLVVTHLLPSKKHSLSCDGVIPPRSIPRRHGSTPCLQCSCKMDYKVKNILVSGYAFYSSGPSSVAHQNGRSDHFIGNCDWRHTWNVLTRLHNYCDALPGEHRMPLSRSKRKTKSVKTGGPTCHVATGVAPHDSRVTRLEDGTSKFKR